MEKFVGALGLGDFRVFRDTFVAWFRIGGSSIWRSFIFFSILGVVRGLNNYLYYFGGSLS